MQYTISPDRLISDCIILERGGRADPRELCDRLTAIGYTRAEFVEGVGQFSLRGGILDVFTAGEDKISQRDLLVHTLVDKPLVNALIMAADDDDVIQLTQTDGVSVQLQILLSHGFSQNLYSEQIILQLSSCFCLQLQTMQLVSLLSLYSIHHQTKHSFQCGWY